MSFWDEMLGFAEATATRVGSQLLLDFGGVQADQKADGSLVTRSDLWADAEIRKAIASTFPSHGILSEEGEQVFPDTEWCWIIDPLDATTNFARGIPIWGISMGLMYRGMPVFGYVHLPPLRQSFHGFWLEGSGLSGTSGAFLNHQPILPCQDALTPNYFFNLCSRSVSLAPSLPVKIRMLGMASYNFLTIAAGAVMGGVEATPKIWDIAGSWPIIQAAGAVWLSLESEALFPLVVGRDYGKKSYPTLVVSREELVSVFLPLVQSLVPPPGEIKNSQS